MIFLGWKIEEIWDGFEVGMWGIFMVCGMEIRGDLKVMPSL